MRIITLFLWIFISIFLNSNTNGQSILRRTYEAHGLSSKQQRYGFDSTRRSDYGGHNGTSLGQILLPQTSLEWGINVVGGLTFVTFLLSDQNVRFMSWHTDRWASRNGSTLSRYDKVEHFSWAAIGQSTLIGLDRINLVHSSPFRRIKLSLLAITWWEIKDSVVPWERYGALGGEGFSTKDWLASAAAVGCTEVLNFVLGKAFGLK